MTASTTATTAALRLQVQPYGLQYSLKHLEPRRPFHQLVVESYTFGNHLSLSLSQMIQTHVLHLFPNCDPSPVLEHDHQTQENTRSLALSFSLQQSQTPNSSNSHQTHHVDRLKGPS
jgi:hypothetical protein